MKNIRHGQIIKLGRFETVLDLLTKKRSLRWCIHKSHCNGVIDVFVAVGVAPLKRDEQQISIIEVPVPVDI